MSTGRSEVPSIFSVFSSFARTADEAATGRWSDHRFDSGRRLADRLELSMESWQELEFRDGLIFGVTQLATPPVGWDEATPVT
jgi:hypothetical protein